VRRTVPLAALVLAACSAGEESVNEAALANFVPPEVTFRNDAEARAARRFRRLDANGDDRIAADELPANGADRIRALDADGDNAVSRDEFVDGRMDRFDARDADDDGRLTTAERQAANAQAR
jgi:hypothetical protein